MSMKPRPTKVKHGKVVPNPNAIAAKGALMGKDPLRIQFAFEAWAAHRGPNRYTEVRARIMTEQNVCKATAERDIAAMRIWKAEAAIQLVPFILAESTEQLQRVADAQEDKQPMATIAALRELHSINGLHVEVVNVGATSPEQLAMINALVMTPHQRQKRIAALKASATPRRPAADPDADE